MNGQNGIKKGTIIQCKYLIFNIREPGLAHYVLWSLGEFELRRIIQDDFSYRLTIYDDCSLKK